MTAMPSQHIYLLLGSNLGNRQALLEQARIRLDAEAGPVTACSPVYETASWGETGQPDYLNQVVALGTSLRPEALLQTILRIERDLGRVRHGRWGNRLIDIDMLYYNEEVIQSETLVVPHPRLHLRNFVLYPLADLAPDFVHPVLKLTTRTLLEQCEDTGKVTRLPAP